MIEFFFNAAPNPLKVSLFLEESGLEYRPVPIDTKRGDQHTDGFRAINPNAKVPAIRDGETTVFDSNAILLYLAEKTGRFLPPAAQRGEMLSWLMFIATGVGPYSGQAFHFRNMAPEQLPYAIKRYHFETNRHWQIIDDRLKGRQYMMGDTYTIVDMAVWGWAPRIPFVLEEPDAFERFTNIKRLLDKLDARPAATRAHALSETHVFQTEMDDTAMRNLYPQIFAPDVV
ncbi:glutathione S-transferase N-terminal domain-containing protein [Roseobacter sp. YSTF-M11]|uniref:Glutathione S-transferase N-terminal domain-containing protein n=1 Tax=Roseobacter insulae TaxID=2859783 RepID=A0A9X1FW47_9RHOB|nr:glutathione S-transferase N-terminal domain-containing protein [Roseobacter insulae]MBW4708422.1 glutathione S-transferase N-terminal domain-containing protein [Roseobacter insulae]